MNPSFSLSLELIYLMGWLLKNEKKMLNELVSKAIKSGLSTDLSKLNAADASQISDQLYTTILDFLFYLEKTLAHKLNNPSLDQKTIELIAPTLKKIDIENLEGSAINLNMQHLELPSEEQDVNANQNDKTPKSPEEIKAMLFKQLLKNWNPTSNETMN